jgi:hypothetical protein
MTDKADPQTFGLDKVLDALRNDLLSAQKKASAGNVGLTIKDAEVEIAFTVESKGGGQGEVNLKVFGVGLGGGLSKERSDSSVHRLKLTLAPLPGSDHAIAGGRRNRVADGATGD